MPFALGLAYLGTTGKICCPLPGTKAIAAEKSNVKTENTTFRVEGMTCGSCEWSVEKALKKMDGVKTAKASNEKSNASVEYVPGKVTPTQMVEALNKLGYKAFPPSELGK